MDAQLPEVADIFERNTPGVMARIDAMRRCAEAGYPVRAVLMPIIPVAHWAGGLRAFRGDVARIGPLVADYARLDLLLPASPTADGTQAGQGECRIVAA